jgi:hypothetical protein
MRLSWQKLRERVVKNGGEDGKAWIFERDSREGLVNADNKALWNADLVHCHAEQWITEADMEDSFFGKRSTIKCYLQTIVSHPGVRAFLNAYSQKMSVIYRRGSLVANMMAVEAMRNDDLSTFFADINDQTFLKKTFLPEKWPVREVPDRIRRAYAVHREWLAPMQQDDWFTFMPGAAWDQALSTLRSKYSQAFKVHVTMHLVRRIKQLIRARAENGDAAVIEFFRASDPKRITASISTNDILLVDHWRTLLCVTGDTTRPPPLHSKDLTAAIFSAHIECCQMTTEVGGQTRLFSPLPVASLSRSFYMVDERIYASVRKFTCFPPASPRDPEKSAKATARRDAKHPPSPELLLERERTESRRSHWKPPTGGIWPDTFVAAFCADRASFRRRKLDARKRLRGRLTAEKRRSVHARMRRQARRGVGCMPLGAVVTSISTDGVAICSSMVIPFDDQPCPSKPPCKGRRSTRGLPEDANSVLISNDPGCHLVYCMCISQNGTGEDARYETLSDEEVEEGSGRAEWKATEARWLRERPEVKRAVASMAEDGGALKGTDLSRWTTCLTAQAREWSTLRAEYISNDERRLWNMKLFRRKRSVLATFVSKVLREASGKGRRRVLFGDGSANFSPTAGKITVPTRYAHRVIDRAFGETGVPGKVIPVDEFNTSKTHHVCGEVLQKNMVASNYVEKRVRMVEVGRVRFCAMCGTKQNPESVQRDPNAARNIMKALIAMVHGRDRPQHLCRSKI